MNTKVITSVTAAALCWLPCALLSGCADPLFLDIVTAPIMLGIAAHDSLTPHGDPAPWNVAPCPSEGDAKLADVSAQNVLKNRSQLPGHINSMIQFVNFYDDSSRKWDSNDAVIIEALVDVVKPGGLESCNCHATAEADRDTHICLVLYPSDYGNPRRQVIVEVTPRWRKYMATKGVDWSTPTLKKTLTHHLVRFTGWIFYDKEHEPESENINPGGSRNFRVTAAELHPVVAIEVLK